MNQNKQHFVYRWNNTKTQEYYIGKHSGHTDDGYVASGRLFLYKYNKNKIDWQREILGFYPDSQQALNAESEYIGELYKTDALCLNLGNGRINLEKLSTEEQEFLYREKYRAQRVQTITDWIDPYIFKFYIYFAHNLAEQHVILDRTPGHVRDFVNYTKQFDEKFDIELLNRVFYIQFRSDQVAIGMVENYLDYIKTEAEYLEVKRIMGILRNMVENYGKK